MPIYSSDCLNKGNCNIYSIITVKKVLEIFIFFIKTILFIKICNQMHDKVHLKNKNVYFKI